MSRASSRNVGKETSFLSSEVVRKRTLIISCPIIYSNSLNFTYLNHSVISQNLPLKLSLQILLGNKVLFIVIKYNGIIITITMEKNIMRHKERLKLQYSYFILSCYSLVPPDKHNLFCSSYVKLRTPPPPKWLITHGKHSAWFYRIYQVHMTSILSSYMWYCTIFTI